MVICPDVLLHCKHEVVTQNYLKKWLITKTGEKYSSIL